MTPWKSETSLEPEVPQIKLPRFCMRCTFFYILNNIYQFYQIIKVKKKIHIINTLLFAGKRPLNLNFCTFCRALFAYILKFKFCLLHIQVVRFLNPEKLFLHLFFYDIYLAQGWTTLQDINYQKKKTKMKSIKESWLKRSHR